jgi:hypothetical protein
MLACGHQQLPLVTDAQPAQAQLLRLSAEVCWSCVGSSNILGPCFSSILRVGDLLQRPCPSIVERWTCAWKGLMREEVERLWGCEKNRGPKLPDHLVIRWKSRVTPKEQDVTQIWGCLTLRTLLDIKHWQKFIFPLFSCDIWWVSRGR